MLVLSVPQAVLLPLLDRDEPRFAEASREMLQSGNYIVPTFNHAPRYAKPPLIYWCQVVSYKVFGETVFAARLPSLLATAGTALLLFFWGSQFGYKTIGIIAAFSYAFCLQTVQQGRVATADALLIFFMTLTGYAGWKLIGPSQSGTSPEIEHPWNYWGSVLAIGFGGGFLAKGPEALLPFVPLMIAARHSGWRIITSLVAILLLGLLIVALWAIPAYVETHGDYWRVGMSEGVGQRMVTGLQGHGASSFSGYLLGIPLYLILFWLSALPWSSLLLVQGKKLFPQKKLDAADGYLLGNAVAIFVVFSLMVTKLPHYTLPAFPFLALFFARRWVEAGLNPRLPVRLTLGFGMAFALLAILVIPTALLNHASSSPVGELVRKAEFIPPFKTEQVPFPHPTAPLVEMPKGVLVPETEFAVVDFQEPNVIWEMRRVANGYGQAIPEKDVLSFLGQPGPRAVVLTSALWQKIEGSLDHAHPPWKTYTARGFNAAKGSLIDLTLVVKN